MKVWPQSFGGRVAVVLTVAIAGVVALNYAVHASDRQWASRPRPLPPAPAPPIRLPVVVGRIRLTLDFATLPAHSAPVVQVFADGGFALRRPLPPPVGPSPPVGQLAAVVLPARLHRLDAAARATLAEVFGALIADRPLPPERFEADFRLRQDALERVLRWVR